MELIDKNDLIKRMCIGAPMNWTDSERELGEESQFRDDMLTIRCCQEVPAIPIPARATNGDMIKAMFPNLESREKAFEIEITVNKNKVGNISIDWWNASYNPQQNLSYTDKSGANIASQDVLRSAT